MRQDQASISERILNHGFGLDPPAKETFVDESDALEHYGILGMKWGVRRTPEQLGHVTKSKQRRNETEKEYKERLDREAKARQQKAQLKYQADTQKRQLKYQEGVQKRQLKSQLDQEKARLKSQEKLKKEQNKLQEKQIKEQAKLQEKQLLAQQKAQEKARKAQESNKEEKKTKSNLEKGDNAQKVKSMTDEEIRAAINRMRLEREYQQMTKKPDGLAKSTLKKIGSIGGGIVLNTGKAIATKKLTEIGSKKLDQIIKEYEKKNKKNKPLGLPAHDEF